VRTSGLVGDGSAINRLDRLLPRKGCHALFTWVSLRLLALGESPQGHEGFHHVVLFELVFDGERMVQTCRFEKFLEVLVQLSCLALEVTLDSHDVLHIKVVHFLVIVVATSGNYDPLGVPLLPPLAPFLVPLPAALDGAPGCGRGQFSHHLEQRWPQLPPC
jgi:hypothetical protein